ncbi:MAG TPA: hypothetical protein PKY82_25015 [Pyrinomonadaceae bacterium]|nr:hypothetical protein [Pyrinomonadaceae bacterium]
MSKKIVFVTMFSLILSVSIFGQKKVEPKIFNVNLIKNGGAETGNGEGWTNSDELKTFRYDGGWGDAWQVTPPNHGDYYFYARVIKDTPIAEFTQKIDVSKIAQDIDANKVSYNLAGWYGIRGGAGVRLILTFYGADGKRIKNSKDEEDATEKFTSENRPSDVEMVEKRKSGQVPNGTRSIKITLEFSLFLIKDDNDGDMALADNLSVVLTNKGDN